MKEKASRKLANGQNIDYSEKENGPRASSAPALGLNTILFKHVYWYMQQISGERLQDHWSSGFIDAEKRQMSLFSAYRYANSKFSHETIEIMFIMKYKLLIHYWSTC